MSSCLVCHRAWPDQPQVCTVCRDRLRVTLGALVAAWRTLSAEPGQGAGERITGTRERPLGARVAVLDLMLPAGDVRPVRDDRRDQVGHIPVAAVLDSWARDWAELLGHMLPAPTVPILANWLDIRLDWACDNHPAIDEYAAEIRQMLTTCRAAMGDIRGDDTITIGPCPKVLDDGTKCRYLLKADPYVDSVACRRCESRWPKRNWLWIHDQETARQLDQKPHAC